MHKTYYNTLNNILEDNKNTEYGKSYNFSQINTFEEYKKNVPLSDYSNFKSYIDKMYNGEINLLTSYPYIPAKSLSNITCCPRIMYTQFLIDSTVIKSFATTIRDLLVIAGRIELDFGVTTLLSLVTNRKFAPPVSSTFVRVAESRNIFSSNPALCASTIA